MLFVLKPSQIYLELSEHIFLQDFAEFSRNLTKIKNKGVKIVIDDVGEGYSSLKTIAELNPDFIANNLTTTEEAEALLELGVKYGQGSLFDSIGISLSQ